jgi:hypothetical protein
MLPQEPFADHGADDHTEDQQQLALAIDGPQAAFRLVAIAYRSLVRCLITSSASRAAKSNGKLMWASPFF